MARNDDVDIPKLRNRLPQRVDERTCAPTSVRVDDRGRLCTKHIPDSTRAERLEHHRVAAPTIQHVQVVPHGLDSEWVVNARFGRALLLCMRRRQKQDRQRNNATRSALKYTTQNCRASPCTIHTAHLSSSPGTIR